MSTNDERSRPAVPRPLSTAGVVTCDLLGFVLRRARDLLLVLILLVFAASALSDFKDIAKFPLLQATVRREHVIETSLLAAIRNHLPTDYHGKDISRWMLFGVMFFFFFAFGTIGSVLSSWSARFRRLRAATAAPLGPARPAAPAVRAEPAKPSSPPPLKKAASAGKMSRKELLEVYAEAKKSLESHRTNLAFLSIDVVDSTGMKIGEDAGIAERDFRQYKVFSAEILKQNNALKSTWTPDGVMVCFKTVADAVHAGQQIIAGLAKFNRETKLIKRDFAIRAGVNSGDVFSDDSIPMEEMTDRVIDIAGHMQKHGCVNGIAISKHSIEPLLGKFQFTDAGRVVDGCPVYEWKPQPVPALPKSKPA